MLKEVVADAILATAALSGSAVQVEDQRVNTHRNVPESVFQTVLRADMDFAGDSGISVPKIRVRKAGRLRVSVVTR